MNIDVRERIESGTVDGFVYLIEKLRSSLEYIHTGVDARFEDSLCDRAEAYEWHCRAELDVRKYALEILDSVESQWTDEEIQKLLCRRS